MSKKIEINGDDTVIVEIQGGLVADYHVPKGIHLIVVDHDVIKSEPDSVSDLEWAAKEFMEKNYR